jgi:WD40 repeat protein
VLAFSPTGDKLATASDQAVRLWDTKSRRLIGKPWPLREVSSLAFTPDGATLLIGSGANSAWLYDVATGKPRCPPLPHRGTVTAAHVSPDSRTAATLCSDKCLRLWDIATGHQLGPPLEHPTPVHAVAFHPDSVRLATGGADGLVRLWDVPAEASADTPVLRAWVESLTGMHLDEAGRVQEIDPAALTQRRRELERIEPFPLADRFP